MSVADRTPAAGANDRAGAARLGFRMPAEWEPHAATWLAWPHNETDWPGRFDVIPSVFVELIRLIHQVERVRLLARDDADVAYVQALAQKAGVDVSRVDFILCPTNRSWTRDYLPTFVVKPGHLGAVKWRFNGWARYDDYEDDDEAGFFAAEWLGARVFEPSVTRDGAERRLVLEGGALDVDGEGTILLTEECLLRGPHGRNPWIDAEGMATVLREQLDVRSIIWLTVGIEGDDTSGHVDDFARFVAPGRVVLCEEQNPNDANYRALRENRERLENAHDAVGRKIEVISLPMPAPVVYEGQRLPASYANFYFANDCLLVPTFDDPMDDKALGILREVVPDRRVLGVRCSDLVLGLGSIHCSTQQEPLVSDEN